MTKSQLFACLAFADADRGIEFLKALGFTERLIVRDPDDPSHVVHAQFRWRDNGGLMVGSVRPGDDREFAPKPGGGRINLVVAGDDEVGATLQRAVAAGGRVVAEVEHQPYGGCCGAVADPEGNMWNIDSYEGE